MKRISKLPGAMIMVATLVAATPVHAASDVLDHGMQQRRTDAFGGLNIRINLTPGQASRSSLRLQSGFRHHLWDPQSRLPAVTRQSAMLEIGANGRGQPRFAIGGTDSRQLGRRLGLSTGATIGIGVLVVAGALAVAVAASSPPDDLIGWDD